MSAPAIVFLHANGFPGPTYRALFEIWRAAGYEVGVPERLGHDPRFPVTSNWPHVRDEVLAFVDAQLPDRRVNFVGHSLGGYLSLLAASRRPGLAATITLLDSPVVGGWRARSVQAMKFTGLMGRLSPGRVSRLRRHQWPDAEGALRHYAAKPVFARWRPDVLRDYVSAGTEPDPAGGVRLRFRREVETRLYDTLPHHLDRLMQRHPTRCPVAFIGGTRSAEVRQAGMEATRRLTHARIEWVEGTHLFPMERPEATAEAVLRAITAMSTPEAR